MNINLRIIVLILLVVIFVVFVGNQVMLTKLRNNSTSIENRNRRLKHDYFYNTEFVDSNTNYPVCSKLDIFRENLERLDKKKDRVNNLYEQLMESNKLSCGNHRTDGGFSKSFVFLLKLYFDHS